MTGTGLGAILFGPAAVSVLGIIVLIFQAVLLAHGGLTTLGANTFSMAVAGPLAAFGIYKLCGKLKVNRRVSVFLAAFLGDIFPYCVTSIQLALAYPSEVGGTAESAVKFLGVFAPTPVSYTHLMVFKTLVPVGKSRTNYVFVVPVKKELNLKKDAPVSYTNLFRLLCANVNFMF